ncbi:MAG: gamma-glutamyl-gamma-aminobutyrate hydrolase family protein [Kiritimatiellae bacterium]|nr:gamma-glutamyl-gamma-aminobutyrate hydrolase family protein [Kiritimatiellia bacterium]
MKRLLLVCAVIGAWGTLQACTVIIVGKKASTTGRVIVGHNEDDRGPYVMRHGRVPAREWPAGSVLPAEKGLAAIPQVPHTLGFFWSELKASWGPAGAADAFLNEKGVLVVSDNAGHTKEDRNDASRLTDGGIFYNIRRAVAERATSAREAVRIIGELVEKWGYVPGGRIYTVADADEGWQVQIVSGRHWAAQRCPDDAIAVCPNHYTIHTLPEKPNDECRFAPDVVTYAVNKGWWPKDRPFDFAAAYQAADWVRNPHNTFRQEYMNSLLLGRVWKDESYPFSVKAEKAVSPDDVKAALCAHPEGVIPHKDDFDSSATCRAGTKESLVCDFGHPVAETVLHVSGPQPCVSGYTALKPLAPEPLPPAFEDHRAVARLDTHFQAEPELAPKPLVVGISDNCNPGHDGVRNYFVDALAQAGHIPVVIGMCKDPKRLEIAVSRIDLLLMTGGADVHPSRYGEANVNCSKIQVGRDDFDFMLMDAAVKRRLPILGVCRGHQLVNIYFGGSLYQDVYKECGAKPNSHNSGKWSKDRMNPVAHFLDLDPTSRLAGIVGTNRLAVNSHHHQAVKRLAPGFKVTAWAEDGVVEAIESQDYPAAGLQFHAESLITCRAQHPDFDLYRLELIFREIGRLCGAVR